MQGYSAVSTMSESSDSNQLYQFTRLPRRTLRHPPTYCFACRQLSLVGDQQCLNASCVAYVHRTREYRRQMIASIRDLRDYDAGFHTTYAPRQSPEWMLHQYQAHQFRLHSYNMSYLRHNIVLYIESETLKLYCRAYTHRVVARALLTTFL